jgi:hypothetical protein
MNTNVGTIDRALRLILGVALIVAPLLNTMGLGANTLIAYTLMAVGGILTLTAIFGVCPLYSVLGIKTNS